MSRVATLLDQLRVKPPREEKYNQTAPIPYDAYYKLAALADHLNLPNSRLAGMLLAAAIDDAIDTLDNTEERVWDDLSVPPMTARGWVQYMAGELDSRDQTEEAIGAYEAEEARKGRKVRVNR
jgi:hypothetical protein